MNVAEGINFRFNNPGEETPKYIEVKVGHKPLKNKNKNVKSTLIRNTKIQKQWHESWKNKQ